MTTPQSKAAERPVSRAEVASYVREALEAGSLDATQLRDEAAARGARPEVIEALGRLPARRFTELRQLWGQLPDMPVDA